jgi:hypothetical protein
MMNTGIQELLLKKRDVAARLSVCARTVERLMATGKLTRVKVPGAVRFRVSKVQNLMNGGAT